MPNRHLVGAVEVRLVQAAESHSVVEIEAAGFAVVARYCTLQELSRLCLQHERNQPLRRGP